MSDEPEQQSENGMVVEDNATVIINPWQTLRHFTPARIGLGRSGHSLPTSALLEFQLAHAEARDAVYIHYEPEHLEEQLQISGYTVLQVESQANDRQTFLRYPDLGRRLAPASRQSLINYAAQGNNGYDAVFVLGDGLSADAIHRHALPILAIVSAELKANGWQIAPIVVASGARVALGDEIGELLAAQQVAIFIGERPGLSAPDSLGIYLTYAPYVGRLEAERNCISNIRPAGLVYAEAAKTLLYLMAQARHYQYTGVRLKDERES